jgi:subfamily B ATP-binding cassette protein MsbA
MEQGRIVERGTHEELYAHGGRYYELYTKQHGLESNLFLAPGEGDNAEAPVQPEMAGDGSAAAVRVVRD